MTAQQVQIIEFKDNSVQLDVRELESILLADNVKDLPVVVVSVAGAYRQGKSFLLNFFLQYLRNNGRPNWLRDMTFPFEGFEWKPGCESHTKGILLWKEVFLMTKSDGEKLAVLLMDTQGVFDCDSTLKGNIAIFSISMLTSSVQVYNLKDNIREDNLQHLEFFAEYGRLAQKESARSFQKLLFLVRDWMSEPMHQYGAAGGRQLLEQRLAIKKGQPNELEERRERIKSCFSEIDCFLMPHPGLKVAKGFAFKDRLEDISEEFRAKLEELIPSILAPKNLLVKEINGRKISCEELMTLFRAYAAVFQGNQMPEAASILEATAAATNVTAVDKARRCYMNEIKNRPQRNLGDLLKFHQDLMKEAKKVFEDHPRMGGVTVSTKYLEGLTKELEEHFCHLFKDEEQAIKKEQEQKAERQREKEEERKREEKRERERSEERKKEEQRKREREEELKRAEQSKREMKEERERAAAAEAKLKSEIEVMKAKEAMEKEKKKKNPIAQAIKGICLVPATFMATIVQPGSVPELAEEMVECFSQ